MKVYVTANGAHPREGDHLTAYVHQLKYDAARRRVTVEAADVKAVPDLRPKPKKAKEKSGP